MVVNEDLLYKHIGHQVKKIRRARELSQEALANKLGVDRTTITNIEGNRQRTPIHILFGLSRALQCDIMDFFPTAKEVTPIKIIQSENIELKVSPKTKELFEKLVTVGSPNNE